MKLTEYLTEDGSAIFSQAGTPGIEGICELHERVTFMHRDPWNSVKP